MKSNDKPKRSAEWQKNNHKMHAILAALAIDEEMMRHLLFKATGKHSRADLSEREQALFIAELETHRAAPKWRKVTDPKPASSTIQWASPEKRALVREIYHKSLRWETPRIEGFVLRVSGRRTKQIDRLTDRAANVMIEAGKRLQIDLMRALIRDNGIDEITFCGQYGCAGLAGLPHGKYTEAIIQLRTARTDGTTA